MPERRELIFLQRRSYFRASRRTVNTMGLVRALLLFLPIHLTILFLNVFQVFSLLLLPISKSLYFKFNGFVGATMWIMYLDILERRDKIKVVFSGMYLIFSWIRSTLLFHFAKICNQPHSHFLNNPYKLNFVFKPHEGRFNCGPPNYFHFSQAVLIIQIVALI